MKVACNVPESVIQFLHADKEHEIDNEGLPRNVYDVPIGWPDLRTWEGFREIIQVTVERDDSQWVIEIQTNEVWKFFFLQMEGKEVIKPVDHNNEAKTVELFADKLCPVELQGVCPI